MDNQLLIIIHFYKKLLGLNQRKTEIVYRLPRLATDSELFAIIECAFNILKGRFNLTTRQRNRLVPHLNTLRKIGRSRSRRGLKSVLQKGRWLGLLPALLTLIFIEALKLIKTDNN